MSLLVLVGRLSESILVYGRGIWRKRMMSNIERMGRGGTEGVFEF